MEQEKKGTKTLKKTVIYTDGSCRGNPGPGGWAAVIREDGMEPREISGGVARTTSVRMELRAVLEALNLAKTRNTAVTVRTDSQNVANGYNNGTAAAGIQKGRQTNADLWKAILSRAGMFEAVTVEWVRGHSGDPDNERCDRLAKGQARGGPKARDKGYEKELAARKESKKRPEGRKPETGVPGTRTPACGQSAACEAAAVLTEALRAGCEAFLASLREQEEKRKTEKEGTKKRRNP